jgi:hypothetical protein
MRGCRLRDCGAPDCPTCAGAESARLYREQQAELDTLDYVADALDDAGDSQGCMEAAAKAKAIRRRMEEKP